MIRVLLASPASELEHILRSSAVLEFAGRIDPADLSSLEVSGDVLLVEIEEANDYDWRSLADLPMPVLLLIEAQHAGLAAPALRAGIRGAILADATPQEIEGAIQAINAGLVVTAPELLQQAAPAAEVLSDPLSERELEVLDLLAEGLSNKLIAHRLNISEHTVKTHVASIFGKLGASSRTEAVSQAIRRGLVML